MEKVNCLDCNPGNCGDSGKDQMVECEYYSPKPNYEEIATVIDNNQKGWTNIIETAPNVTLDVGTKLYVKNK